MEVEEVVEEEVEEVEEEEVVEEEIEEVVEEEVEDVERGRGGRGREGSGRGGRGGGGRGGGDRGGRGGNLTPSQHYVNINLVYTMLGSQSGELNSQHTNSLSET